MSIAPTSVHPPRGLRPLLIPVAAFLLGCLVVALLFGLDVFGGSSGSPGEGSGISVTQPRHVGPFSAIELAGANNVVVRVGGSRSVEVRGDDNLVGRVSTIVRARTLVVSNTSGSFRPKTPMSVTVSVPSLDALTLSGNGNIAVGGVDAARLQVRLPGSGTLTADGTVTSLDVSVDGSGTVELPRLVAQDARAAVGGSGSIVVNVARSLDASISGSGTIVYLGSPTHVTRNITGSGAVTGG